MQILIWVMMIVGGARLCPRLILFWLTTIILVWKIFRKVKYHIAICD